MTAAELRKIWIVSDIDSASVAINGYRGTDTVLEIPEKIGRKTVTRIGERAFRPESHKRLRNLYRSIQGVTIPGTVTCIGNEAFANCKGLKQVNLNEGLHSISDAAFENCKSLVEIVIPGTVSSLSAEAFSGCISLQKCTLFRKRHGLRKVFFSVQGTEIINSSDRCRRKTL